MELQEINIYNPYINCNCNKLTTFGDNFIICHDCVECKNLTYNVKTDNLIEKNIYKFFYKDRTTDEDILNYSKLIFGNDVDLGLIYKPYLLTCDTSVCITQKPDCIGLYFLSLTYDNFIKFLDSTQFEDTFTLTLSKNSEKISHLKFDVGFDVIVDKSISFTKLSFYGIL